MRTDTERLNFLLQVMESEDEDAAERIQGAFMLGLKGRPALDAAMGAKLVEPGEPMPELTAIDLAVAELGRIRNVKGFSEERDDGYVDGSLGLAAVAYLRSDGGYWPPSWDAYPFKPSPDDRKRELTKGIALALCELDRLIRAERRAESNSARWEHEQESRLPDTGEPEVPHEFKVGDRVRVISNSHENPFGWAGAMDRLVGNVYPIESIFNDSIDQSSCYKVAGWYFPLESLEHVDG